MGILEGRQAPRARVAATASWLDVPTRYAAYAIGSAQVPALPVEATGGGNDAGANQFTAFQNMYPARMYNSTANARRRCCTGNLCAVRAPTGAIATLAATITASAGM
jgi:hypothetical protein